MYNGKFGKSTIKFTQDLAFRNIKSYQNSEETDIATEAISKVSLSGRNRYDISTSRADYTLRMPWQLQLLAGAAYKYIRAENDLKSDDLDFNNQGYYRYNSLSHEENVMAYLTFYKPFGRLTVQLTGIYNYLYRKTDNKTTGTDVKPVTERHSEFLPLAQLVLNCGKGWSVWGMYRQMRNLPNYSEINSGLVYNNAYMYYDGNPDLKSSLTHIVRIGASWRDLKGYVRYRRDNNPMISVETPLSEESNVVRSWTTNIPHSESWELSLSYSKYMHGLNLSVDGWIDFPDYKIPGKNGIIKITTPYGGGSINLSYRFNKHFSTFTDYNFTSYRKYDNSSWKPLHQWNLSINGSFLSDRLNVSLRFSDILNKEHYSNCKYFWDDVRWGTRGRSDQRGIQLFVSYTLFNTQLRTTAKNYNESELMRTAK